MGRPKALKSIIIGCVCLVPIGLVVGLSVNWNHTTFISAMGSSGARGIVNGFGQKYHIENEKIEINAESGGTATGLTSVYDGLCDIGNSTANPYYFVNQWENMKTFTLGWEGIALIYKMPDRLSQDAQKSFDISINAENIKYLYAIFSAYNEVNVWEDDRWVTRQIDPNSEETSFYGFLTEEAKSKFTDDDIAICKSTQILPYVRSGGDRSAGITIAFSKRSHFTGFELTQNQEIAYAGGQYGHDRQYYETDESNAQAWSMFEYNDKPGQMVYMTTSFLNQSNLELINQKGYRIAKYNNVSLLDDDGTFNIEQICKTSGYNWFRPINCSVNINNEKATNFLKWIYSNNDYSTYPKSFGIKPISQEQKQTMGSFDIDHLQTDIELDTGDHIYGARELLE